ncbi:von Willebrand factor type A domain-containing protein [Saccharicrinis sp. FJH54]|uniref:vWA domain-containing protein n=1 Tax=Saccharicrinis sp. FJH54 TaxID=3344665 RepID=UPI0035D4F99D
MKTIAALFMIIFCVLPIASQKVIRGKVMNGKTNLPVYMVKVSTGTELAFTDKMGEFQLLAISADSLVTLQKDGFKTVITKVLPGEKSTIHLTPLVMNEPKVDDSTELLEESDISTVVAGQAAYEAQVNRTLVFKDKAMSKQAVSFVVPPVYHNPVNDEYSQFEESGFKSVNLHPLSTFSVDVDNASYAITRRHINNGMLPPENAIRVEEMINYFRYGYPTPEKNKPIAVSLSSGQCPWNQEHYLLRIGIQTKVIETDKLPKSNFVFLIDISGSMSSADKLPLAKASLKTFLETLRDDDRVAIVTYAGSTRVVLESTPVKDKQTILRALEQLNSGGSTAGAEGLKLAYSEAERGLIKNGNNRIILVTDGDFNVGPSSVEDLKTLIKDKRDKGIFISILGFGQGNLKDNRMEAIADNGNGNYGYVDNLQEAHKILMKEFTSNLFVVAKDVKIQIEFNPSKIASYRLVGYDNRALAAEDFNNDKKDAGEMGADQQVTALYEIALTNSESRPVVDPLRYTENHHQTQSFMNELGTVKIRYKEPDSDERRIMVTRIDSDLLNRDKGDAGFNMAASVAMFGQLLRKSDYISQGDFSTVANLLAKTNYNDTEGYKAELLRLVELASKL